MKSRKYLVYDVFTEQALAGNPLGVVLDCDGLDTPAMQAIAREFNLSETVFILPPENPRHRARVRIFTPGLRDAVRRPSDRRRRDRACRAAGRQRHRRHVRAGGEHRAGALRRDDGRGRRLRRVRPARLPAQMPLSADAAALGAAARPRPARDRLRKPPAEPVVGRRALCHRPGGRPRSGGEDRLRQPCLDGTCPVQGGGRCRFGLCLLPRDACITTAPSMRACSCRARRPTRIRRPARRRRPLPARSCISTSRSTDRRSYWIEQGIEMGRPSRIRLEIDVEAGSMAGARIGGHAVKVAEGTLFA